VKHSAFAETALVKLAPPRLFNDVGCKCCPHEFLLLIRKARPARFDGLPRGIECGEENGHGLRIKDAGLYVTVEEVAHFARPGFHARRSLSRCALRSLYIIRSGSMEQISHGPSDERDLPKS
jgi:hypothetical protein